MFKIIKEISKGKTVMKAMTNFSVAQYTLKGKVVDVGAGADIPSYQRFLKKSEGVKIINVDLDAKDDSNKIDLEKDKLPMEDGSVDQVLMFNLLEHIYDHKFVLSEANRVLKNQGVLLGFVPFLIAYHPDPHDYFRYTKEALYKLFKATSFDDISISSVGMGPFIANYNNIMVLFPIFIRVILFPFYYILDLLLIKIKPSLKERFVLGYIFRVKKT